MVRVSAGGFEWIDRGPGRVDLISGRVRSSARTATANSAAALAAPDLNGDGDGDLLVWTTNAASNGGWRLQALGRQRACLPNAPRAAASAGPAARASRGPHLRSPSPRPGAASCRPARRHGVGTTCIGGPPTRVAISATGGGGSTTVPVPTGGLLAGEGRTYQWFWRDGASSSDAVSVTRSGRRALRRGRREYHPPPHALRVRAHRSARGAPRAVYDRLGVSVGRLELMSGIRERRFSTRRSSRADALARAGISRGASVASSTPRSVGWSPRPPRWSTRSSNSLPPPRPSTSPTPASASPTPWPSSPDASSAARSRQDSW